jgi:hypothetical protein
MKSDYRGGRQRQEPAGRTRKNEPSRWIGISDKLPLRERELKDLFVKEIVFFFAGRANASDCAPDEHSNTDRHQDRG